MPVAAQFSCRLVCLRPGRKTAQLNGPYWCYLAARCLDQYFELRVKEVEQKEQVDIDPRLVAVVERMMDRWAALVD